MRRVRGSFVLGAVLVLSSMALGAPPASALVCGPSFIHNSSPNVGTDTNYFNAMTATADTNAWAVGTYRGTTTNRTLAEQWNGSWSVAHTPNSGTGYNSLTGAASVSKNNVWAVGSGGSHASRTLTEHWNGSAWKIVKSPNVGKKSNLLWGATAVSSSNVWAVGQEFNGTVNRTLTEHWNGSAWSVVPSPNVTKNYGNVLYAASASSASNVWAVGYGHQALVGTALAERWNGAGWKLVTTPTITGSDTWLYGVATLSKSNAWAVGYAYDRGTGHSSTLIEHWDGSVWVVVSSPSPDPTYDQLYAITVVSPTDIWAAGDAGSPTMPIVLHWDGLNWSQVSLPPVGTSGDAYGAASTSTGVVWIAGDSSSGSTFQTSVFQRCP